ncbi:MAG TPA: thermonuclease family protein [Blastocatellia bacterium]|nr:thermonuclease family protein [Blastocatellia bacterium]
MKMLEFKRPQPVPDKNQPSQPRWNIGIDPKHVAAYIGAAIIGGFVLGFIASRLIARTDAGPQTGREQALANPVRQDSPTDSSISDFHRVTNIVRADTIEVDQIGVVRLIGVETPDGKQPRESYEVHGKSALAFVEKSLLNQEVRLEFDSANASKGNKDEVGQTLAYVYTRDGMMINSELVRLGLAFVRGFEQFRASNDFRGLEREAVQNSRGVWGSASGSSVISPLASTTASSSTSSSSSSTRDDKSKKLSPLPPSAFGDNIPALTSGSGSTASSAEASVFVSSADHMYHKGGCELLDKKKRPMTLSEARASGYTACSRCYASTVLKAP